MKKMMFALVLALAVSACGATLAGTKNYLLIAQRAYENAQGK